MKFSHLALALLLGLGAVARAQDPEPPKPEAPKVDREKEAETLFNQGLELEKQSKWADAAEGFRKLKKEYGYTTMFGLKNYQDIGKHLKACGMKVAEIGLKDQKLSKDPHIDGINGLEFNPPEGWRGVPPRKAFTDRKRSDMMAEFDFLYKGEVDKVARYTSAYFEDVYIAVYKIYGPESLKDVETSFEKALREATAGKSEPLKLAYPASRIVYTGEKGDMLIAVHLFEPNSKFGYVVIGTWENAEAVGDSTVTAGSSDNIVKLVDTVARSVRIIKKDGLDAYKKKWNNGAKAVGWRAYKTKNFLFEYNADENWVKTLAEHFEQIQALYKQYIPSPNKIPMCVVKVFPNEEDFMYYSGAYGAAAYWSPSQEEVVCYQFTGGDVKTDTGATKKITNRLEAEDVTFRIIYHEGFHQYMHYAMGKNRELYLPSWLNEGMGDFFFGGKFILKNGKPSQFSVGLNDWRTDTIRAAVKKNKHVPVRKILEYQQRDYYSNAGLCYAEGWALCHFLMTHADKKYNQFVSKFIDALRKDDDYLRVTKKVLGDLGIDPDKLEAEWKTYVIAMKKDAVVTYKCDKCNKTYDQEKMCCGFTAKKVEPPKPEDEKPDGEKPDEPKPDEGDPAPEPPPDEH